MYLLFLKKFNQYNTNDAIRIEEFYTEYGPDVELLQELIKQGYAIKMEDCDR